MIRFVDYRKNLLRSSAQRSNVLEGVDRYFEILRLDLIEATKFPRNLSEEFLGDASVMLDRLSNLTNEVHKYIIHEDVNTFKKVFHRFILETAAAASPPNLAAILAGGPGTLTGDAATQLKAKLIWAIKQFIDEIKKEVTKQISGLSATATTAASNPTTSPATNSPVSRTAPAPSNRPATAPTTTSAPADVHGGSHVEDPEEEPAPGSHRPTTASPYHHRSGIYQPYPSMPATGGRWKKSTSDPNNNWFGGIGNMFKSVGQWFKDKLHRGWHGANLADSVRGRLVNLIESTNDDVLDALMKTIDEFGKQIIGYIEKNSDEYIASLKSGAATTQPAVASNPATPPADDPSVIQGRSPTGTVDASKAAPGSVPPQAAATAKKSSGPGLSEKNKQAVIEAVKAGRMVPTHLCTQLYALAQESGSYKHDKEDPDRKVKAWRACRKMFGLPDNVEPQAALAPTAVALTPETINELRALVVGVDKPIAVDRLKQKCAIKGSKAKKGLHRNSIRSAMRHFGVEGASANTNLPNYMGDLYDKIIETKDQKAEELSANGYKAPVANQPAAAAASTTPPKATTPPPKEEKPQTQTQQPALAAARAAFGGGGDKGGDKGAGETPQERDARLAREEADRLLGRKPAAQPQSASTPPKEEKPAVQPQPASTPPKATTTPPPKEEKPAVQPQPASTPPKVTPQPQPASTPPKATTTQPPKEEKPAVQPQPASTPPKATTTQPPKEEKPAVQPQPAAATWTPPEGVDEANLDVDGLMVLLNPDDPDNDGFNKLKDVSDHVLATLDKVDKVVPGFKACCPGFSDDAVINQVIQKVYPEVKAKCGNKFDGRDPATMEALKKAMLEENIRAGKVEYLKKNAGADTAKLDADVASAAGLAPPPGSESKKASGPVVQGKDGSVVAPAAQPEETEEEDRRRQQNKVVEKAYAAIPEEKRKLLPPEAVKAKILKIVSDSWDREDFQKMRNDQLYQVLAHLAVHENVSPTVLKLGGLPEIYEGLQSIRGANLDDGSAREDPMKKLETFLAKKKIRSLKDEFPQGWDDEIGFGQEDLIVSRMTRDLLAAMEAGHSYEESIAGLRKKLQQAQAASDQRAKEEEEREKVINAPPPPDIDEVPEDIEDKVGAKDEDDLAIIKAADDAMREPEEEQEVQAALNKKFPDVDTTYTDFLTNKLFGGSKDLLHGKISDLLKANGNDKDKVLSLLTQEADALRAKLGDEAAFDWMPKKQGPVVKPEDDIKSQLSKKRFEHGKAAPAGHQISHPQGVGYTEFLKKKKFDGDDAKLRDHILDILLKKGGDITATVDLLSKEAEELKNQLGSTAFDDIVTSEEIPDVNDVEDDDDDEDEVEIPQDDPKDTEEIEEEKCAECHGTGKCPGCCCKTCGGTGKKGAAKCPDCYGLGVDPSIDDCGLCSGSMICGGCEGSGLAGVVDDDDEDEEDDYDDSDEEQQADMLVRDAGRKSDDEGLEQDSEYDQLQAAAAAAKACTYCKGRCTDPKDRSQDCPACEGDGTIQAQDEIRASRGLKPGTDPYYKKN